VVTVGLGVGLKGLEFRTSQDTISGLPIFIGLG
jgi:hypothetical protein